MIFLSLKNALPFCLQEKRSEKSIFNTKSELLQNRTDKQIMPLKTTVNWLFNAICYLAISCFDWKFDVFQQTVVRAYYSLEDDHWVSSKFSHVGIDVNKEVSRIK